jgi:hypothetical protein
MIALPVAAAGTRDAKVAQVGVAVLVEHDVAGLEVAVDDAPDVRVIKRLGDLCKRLFQCIKRGDTAPDHLRQAAALNSMIYLALAANIDRQVRVFQIEITYPRGKRS